MGEIEQHRPARLMGALTVAAAVGLLLASCAGLPGGAAGAGEPTAAPPAASTPAPIDSSSAPAPDQTAVADPTSSAAPKDAVEPFITLPPSWNGSGIDVGALVPKVVESGGTCTARAERDGVVVERSGAAVAASSYTGCPQLVLQGSQLVPGTWSVTVSYSSERSAGTSKPASVTVQ